VIIESIFGLPGLGRFLFDAILQRDYPVIQGINLLVVSMIVVLNLIVDLFTRCSTRASGIAEAHDDGEPRRGHRAARAARRESVDPPLRRAVMTFCRRKPLGAVGGAIVLVMLVMAVGADWVAPLPVRPVHRRRADETARRAEFWLGTDNLSRDLWSAWCTARASPSRWASRPSPSAC